MLNIGKYLYREFPLLELEDQGKKRQIELGND